MKGALCVMVGCAFLITGCKVDDVKQDNADIVHKQIGRFTMLAGQEGYPPLILDTAAGCVMALSKQDDGTVSIDEVSFPGHGGGSSCNAMKQLLVVDTLSRIKP